MQDIQKNIEQIIHDLFKLEHVVTLTRPDSQFGDFSTNVALQISKQIGENPKQVAEQLANEIHYQLQNEVGQVSVAGPGFINIRLNDSLLLNQLSHVTELPQTMAGKRVVAEYSDPNPFKILHAGHLYTSIVGDSIANLVASSGAVVHRVNYGGDVGLHVGKTMWAIIQKLNGENPDKLQEIAEDKRSAWLGSCYINGTNVYDENETSKAEIVLLNKRVYALHAENDHDSPLAQIYWTTRQWSYDYFDSFYQRIGTRFDKYYPESDIAELGLKIVKEQLKRGVFEESEGAVVFKGGDHGLHTRVFISSQGLPTYEAKEVGLILTKKAEYNFDRSIVITGNEQAQYMQVVLKAIEQFRPDLVKETSHLTHGLVKLQGGVKMSSRKGNILRAVEVLEAAAEANKKATGKEDDQVVLGAVKYAFLKVRTGGDIVYDPEESVSLEGNSGPYLQYAFARANSILKKSPVTVYQIPADLQAEERALVVKLTEYREVVTKATEELSPHLVCTYLYEIAQVFNRFYEKNRVIDDPRQTERLMLVSTYANVLKAGLGLLGIHAPESM